MAWRLDRRLDRAASRHLRFRLGRELRAHLQHGELRRSAVDLLRAALGHQGRFGSHLWVEEYEFPGEERPGSLWTVFGPEGHVLGFVETPEAPLVLEVGEDYILTWFRDELDVDPRSELPEGHQRRGFRHGCRRLEGVDRSVGRWDVESAREGLQRRHGNSTGTNRWGVQPIRLRECHRRQLAAAAMVRPYHPSTETA